MAVYKQPREEVRVRIHTPEFRVYGSLHLVPGRTTADLFNLEQRDVVPVTAANLFTPGIDHPPAKHELRGRVQFMGLNRTRVLWVVGGRAAGPAGATTKEVPLALLYHDYLLAGRFQLPKGQRISDHLHAARPFHPLSSVKLYPLAEGQSLNELEAVTSFDFVTFNVSQALAVIEG